MSHPIGLIPSTRIDRMLHPHFVRELPRYERFRSVFEGGRHFVNKYTEKFTARETDPDFQRRKRVTYSPSHAKAAVIDVRNAIFQRMADIIRTGGPKTYQDSINGKGRGVDLRGSSMNAFIGRTVLQELLVLGRVGVYIDKPPVPERSTLKTSTTTQPYLYFYSAEDIRSWHYNEINELDAVLVEDHFFKMDDDSGLIIGEDTRFRLMTLHKEGVLVRFFGLGKEGEGPEILEEKTKLLDLTRIPFVLLELNHSLLHDISDYQIALLNLGSSDMNYALQSNFPFYTEQYSAMSELPHSRPGGTEGTASEAGMGQPKSINTGATQGRRYPRGLERPGFIHPSPDPLLASMEKQQRLVEEIRQLINLALSNVRPTRASAESKQIDNQGLEAGLSYIGLELEFAEREIAKIWTEYEGEKKPAFVTYPDNYQLRTDKERRQEAKELEALKPATPSPTFKKEICKQIARVTLGTKVEPETMEQINAEIERAVVIEVDAETVRNDHEAGFVSTETASKVRGYPEGEAEQAAKDHAERLARIAAAQSSVATDVVDRPAARGVPDGDGDSDSGSQERAASRETDTRETTQDPTRGEA